MNYQTKVVLSTVFPLLVLLVGLLICIYLCTKSHGINLFRSCTRIVNATPPDIQQNMYVPPLVNSSSEQFCNSDALPSCQVNIGLYAERNYENVMVDPISQETNCTTTSACEPAEASEEFDVFQSMDIDEPIYENNPFASDSPVYCNYAGQICGEEDDTYIIPSE